MFSACIVSESRPFPPLPSLHFPPSCGYVGRFAPSPSGPLHAGSVVAALASWLDARAHDGRWLLRIEDIDPPRVEPGSDIRIRRQLRFLGLHWDDPPWYQSARVDRYAAALAQLRAQGLIFGCSCTRREITQAWQTLRQWLAQADAQSMATIPGPAPQHQGSAGPAEVSPAQHAISRAHHSIPEQSTHTVGAQQNPSQGRRCATERDDLAGIPADAIRLHAGRQRHTLLADNIGTEETPYLGTCRQGLAAGRTARAWRFRVDDRTVHFEDRWLGPQAQTPRLDCGDVVLRRADGVWAYQLAVVVDDAEAGITDIVRGADLLSSTGRQILLQQALGMPTPRYLHLPLLMGDNGQKLSKQNGAPAVDDSGNTEAVDILNDAARYLELKTPDTRDPQRWLAAATDQWRAKFRQL